MVPRSYELITSKSPHVPGIAHKTKGQLDYIVMGWGAPLTHLLFLTSFGVTRAHDHIHPAASRRTWPASPPARSPATATATVCPLLRVRPLPSVAIVLTKLCPRGPSPPAGRNPTPRGQRSSLRCSPRSSGAEWCEAPHKHAWRTHCPSCRGPFPDALRALRTMSAFSPSKTMLCPRLVMHPAGANSSAMSTIWNIIIRIARLCLHRDHPIALCWR